MDFKKLNPRSIMLAAVAILLLFSVTIIRTASHGAMPEQSPQIPVVDPNQAPALRIVNSARQLNEFKEEDSSSMKEMKEQMDNDRLQQKKIKTLKLQLEQTNLKLEQEKALSEINKLENGNTGVVNESNDRGEDKYPDVKVIYIGGTTDKKEAILSINGNNYSVKEKNKPVKNVEVLSITDTNVVVHFNMPQDLRTAIEYKPE